MAHNLRAMRSLCGAVALLFVTAASYAASTTLVVNEIQTAGAESAADEFVEIANISAGVIDLTGFKLVYRSATSESDTVLVRFTNGPFVPGGGVLVYGGAEFLGPRDGSFSGSLAANGGGVAILDAEGKPVDKVAWGEADNGFAETRATVAPEKGHSIHRIPCGNDTDYNARDLQELLVPTPRVQCDGTRAPSVTAASFAPLGVEPGGESVLTAAIAPGTYPIASVTADLTALGGAPTAPLSLGAGHWTVTVRVATGTAPGPAPVRVRVADTRGGTGYASASLYVKNPAPARVVVNEVQTAGDTADVEFVELYNRTDAEVDLAGFRLAYRGPTSEDDTALHTFGDVRLKARGYYLLGTDAFRGPKDATIKPGLSGSGGGLALRDAEGKIIDSMGYGTATHAFVETRAAPAPKAGHSVERSPIGADTNDNAADFKEKDVPTPTPAVNKPVVASVAFQPPGVPPGGTTTLTATVVPGDAPVTEVAADLIVILGETNHPLAHTSGNAWSATVTVDPLTTIGTKRIAVYAKDALGLVAEGEGTLSVIDVKPAPPVKVNEVQTGGTGSGADEFVELYNPGAAADLSGWTLVYRSEKGTSDTVLFRFTGQSIAAQDTLLIVGEGFSGARNGSLLSGLSATGGSVGLRDASGALVDSVGYGTAENALVETAPAPAPVAGRSIGRKTAGQDTNNNANDFRIENPPSPKVGGTAASRPGDADRDGLLTVADVATALRLACGLTADGPSASLMNADVWPAAPAVSDGHATLNDALAILGML